MTPTPHASAAADAGGEFVPLTAFRLVDTGQGIGGSSSRLGAAESREYQVLGVGGVPATGVAAVVVDIAAISLVDSADSWLRVYPSGGTLPDPTVLRVDHDHTPRSNTVVTRVGSNGKIRVHNAKGAVHFNLDVQGYFTTSDDGSGFKAIDQTRIVSTTEGIGVPAQELAGGTSVDVQVTGSEVPAGATAIFANVKVSGADLNGGLRLGAGGTASSAPASINYRPSVYSDSGMTIKLSSAGKIRITNLETTGDVAVFVDVQGYFMPGYEGGTFTPLSGARIYDTNDSTPIPGGGTRSVTIAGLGGLPGASDLGAAVLTVFAGNWTASGSISVYPAGTPDPGTSSLSFNTNSDADLGLSSTSIVATSTTGAITIKNRSSAPVRVLLNAQGWFGQQSLIPPNAPTVESPLVANGETSEPLPSDHAFQLASDESDAPGFYVTQDTDPAVFVTATQGVATYRWAPALGTHTLSVAVKNKYGIRSRPTVINFGIRERILVDPPATVLDEMLAPNQTADLHLTSFVGGAWSDVDTFIASVSVTGWTDSGAGSLWFADGQDVFPASPSVQWGQGDDPAVGSEASVELAPGGDDTVILRNTSESSVRVKLVMSSWLRQMDNPDDDQAAEVEEGVDVEEDDAESDDTLDIAEDGDAAEPPLNTPECSETGAIHEESGLPVISCKEALDPNLLSSETIANAQAAASTQDDGLVTTFAASAAGYDPPLHRPCTPAARKWRKSRFAACRRDYYLWVDKIRHPNGTVEIIGQLWAFVERKIWMGYLTKAIDTETRVYRTGATGTFDTSETGVIMRNYCDSECSGGGSKATSLTRTHNVSDPLRTSFHAALGTEDVDDYRINASVDVYNILGSDNDPIIQRGSPEIRCDNVSYIPSAGCRVVAFEPRMIMRISDPRISNAAAFYGRIQRLYGWGTTKYFTRANLAQKKANRDKACSGWKGPPSCDEFPFAFTLQGCKTETRPHACNREGVPLNENRYAGSLVGAWLGKNRILRNYPDEQFYFEIRP